MSQGDPIDVSDLQHESFGAPAQLLQAMEIEVRDGRLTQAQADAMLRADGIEPPKRENADAIFEAKAPDEAESVDDLPGFEPAKAHEYRLPPLVGPDELITEEVRQTEQRIRGWLTAARFPKAIGSDLAANVYRTEAQLRGATDAEVDAYIIREKAELQKLWGSKYAQRVALADQLLREIEAKSPGVMAFLRDTKGGHSASVIANLAMQAERLASRRNT